MSEATKFLYSLVEKFEEDGRRGISDSFPYRRVLEELLFQADLRFGDYLQFQTTEGEFPVRLRNWIANGASIKEQKALFKLAQQLVFIDKSQTASLCRDAYRRIIVPWLRRGSTIDEYLSPTCNIDLISSLNKYALFSITESFYFSDFRNVNNLSGLIKPTIFPERVSSAKGLLPLNETDVAGLIIFEDLVGSGEQASRLLKAILPLAPASWRMLFVPLIMFEEGYGRLTTAEFQRISVKPVLNIGTNYCVKAKPSSRESSDIKLIRSLVTKTAHRVLERLNENDDPPENPFGYNGCGATIVPYRNSPNNTLPLIHHQAPTWKPLFRRVHHGRRTRNVRPRKSEST